MTPPLKQHQVWLLLLMLFLACNLSVMDRMIISLVGENGASGFEEAIMTVLETTKFKRIFYPSKVPISRDYDSYPLFEGLIDTRS